MNIEDLQALDAEIERARNAGDDARADRLTEVMVESLRRSTREAPGGFLSSVAQGATLGLADELMGLVGGPEATRGVRENLARYREDSPVGAFVGEAVGGLGTGSALGAGLLRYGGQTGRWLSAPRMGPQTALGAGEGALYGAGTAEGSLTERLPGAGTGALAGGILGAVAAPATAALTRRLSPQAGAETLVNTALRRDLGRTPMPSDYDAISLMSGLRPQRTLGEMGGANLQDLARTAASMPGEAKAAATRVLEARRVTMPERLSQALERGTGVRTTYWKNIRELDEQASKLAGPKYTEAYNAPFSITPALDELTRRGIDTGDLRRGYNNAWRIARLEGRKLPKWKEVLDEQGNLRPLSLEQYDWIKRGLDAEYKRLVSSNPALARSVWIYRQQMVGELDRAVPAYAEARQLYAGPMAQKEAQEAGRGIFTEDAEYTQDFVAQLSQGEKDAYTLGAVSALKDRLKNVPMEGGTPRLTQLAAERLQAAFPNADAFKEFIRDVLDEREMAAFRNMVMAGSHTQRIAASQQDITRTLGVGGGLRQMVTGDPLGGAQTVLGALRPPSTATIPPRLQAPLSSMLFAQGTDIAPYLPGLQRPGPMPPILPPMMTTGAVVSMPDLLDIISQEPEL